MSAGSSLWLLAPLAVGGLAGACCPSGSTMRLAEATKNPSGTLCLERWIESGGGAAGWVAHVVVLRQISGSRGRLEVLAYVQSEPTPQIRWISDSLCEVASGDSRLKSETLIKHRFPDRRQVSVLVKAI
jgi:hypothetical protein